MKEAFPPIVSPESTVLFLGTMPGEKSLQLRQYYGNRGNQFWRLLFKVLGQEYSDDYTAKLNLISTNNFAMWDVLQYCEREGSLDSNIKNAVPNDFSSFYQTYPRIRTVLFTSKNASVLYGKMVGIRAGLRYEVLPSPSGANATMKFEEKLEIWQEKILPLVTR